jgi:hypothetical protein
LSTATARVRYSPFQGAGRMAGQEVGSASNDADRPASSRLISLTPRRPMSQLTLIASAAMKRDAAAVATDGRPNSTSPKISGCRIKNPKSQGAGLRILIPEECYSTLGSAARGVS